MVICKFKFIMKLDCWDLKNELCHSRASFIRICCWFSLSAGVHSLMAVATQTGSVKFAFWLHWQCKKIKNKNSIRLKTKYFLPQLFPWDTNRNFVELFLERMNRWMDVPGYSWLEGQKSKHSVCFQKCFLVLIFKMCWEMFALIWINLLWLASKLASSFSLFFWNPKSTLYSGLQLSMQRRMSSDSTFVLLSPSLMRRGSMCLE